MTIVADGITMPSHPGEIYYRGEDCAVSCHPVNLWHHQTSPLLLLNKIILPRSEPLFVCLRELPEFFFIRQMFDRRNLWLCRLFQNDKLKLCHFLMVSTVYRLLDGFYPIDAQHISTHGDDLGENTEYLFSDVRCEVNDV